MLANIIVVMLLHNSLGGRTQRFFGEAIALEVYHAPKWFLSLIRSASRGMGTTHLVSAKPLKAAAERRAAKLRAQMMDGDADGPTAAASEAAAQARRHLRNVATLQ